MTDIIALLDAEIVSLQKARETIVRLMSSPEAPLDRVEPQGPRRGRRKSGDEQAVEPKRRGRRTNHGGAGDPLPVNAPLFVRVMRIFDTGRAYRVGQVANQVGEQPATVESFIVGQVAKGELLPIGRGRYRKAG